MDPNPKTTQGIKFDHGKAPLGLISSTALFALSRVLEYGATKYAPHNWRKGLVYSRLLDAALRHLWLFIGGEDTDPETGLYHVDHALCNLMFLCEFVRTRPDLDDRYKGEAK